MGKGLNAEAPLVLPFGHHTRPSARRRRAPRYIKKQALGQLGLDTAPEVLYLVDYLCVDMCVDVCAVMCADMCADMCV